MFLYGEHHPWVSAIYPFLCYYLQAKVVIRYGINHLQTIKDRLECIVKVVPCRTLIDHCVKGEMPVNVPIPIDSALLVECTLVRFQLG
jgi:hypothetical protein